MKNNKQKKEIKHTYVTSGKIKGRLIENTPGVVRPMTSKVRQALFNIIGNCEGMEMLDLFCGSGSISIEAYSHGMESSDLVEMDYGKKAVIERNLKKAGFENAFLYSSDAVVFCQRCTRQYDFIMCDPPFAWTFKERLIETISESNLLKDNGFLVIHLPKKEKISEEIGNYIQYDYRNYGINAIAFYKKK